MKSKDKKGNITRTENITKIAFEGARVALPVFIDEYSKECDRKNVMQSFAPLFLILLIKYFDFRLVHLCKKFFEIILRNPIWAFTRAITHSALQYCCLN